MACPVCKSTKTMSQFKVKKIDGVYQGEEDSVLWICNKEGKLTLYLVVCSVCGNVYDKSVAS